MVVEDRVQEKLREIEMFLAFLENAPGSRAISAGLRSSQGPLDNFERETVWYTLADVVCGAPDEAWLALDREPERLYELGYPAELRLFEQALHAEEFYDVDMGTLSRRLEHLRSRREEASRIGDEEKANAFVFYIERIVRVVGYLVRFRSRIRLLPDPEKDAKAPALKSDTNVRSIASFPRTGNLRLVPK